MTELKNQQISALIAIEYLRNGGDIAKAMDAVCGEGSYLKLVGEVWEAAQAKA